MTWLVVQGAEVRAAFPNALPTSLPQPVQRGLKDAEELAARGLKVAIVDEAMLGRLRGARTRATTFAVSSDALTFTTEAGPLAVPRADLAAAFVVEERGDDLLCLARRSGPGLIVLASSTLNPTFLPTRPPSAPEAFRMMTAGFAALIGRPVDESLRGHAGVFGLSATDVVDVGAAMLRGELSPPPAAPAAAALELDLRRPTAQPAAATVTPPPAMGDEPRRMRKCQTCDNIVDENDSYRVFSLPSCDGCTQKYVHGGGQRALMLSGIFVGALLVFAVLVFFLGFIGRIVGALLVLFAFYVVLHTGAQYDVDVERQRGARLDVVRRAGFFKKWGDLDSKWWGKWLLHRGLYAILGTIAWFVPIGASAASSSDDDVHVAEVEQLPRTVLKPLGPGVAVNGKTIALVEVVSTDESLAVVLEIGGRQQHVPADDVEKVLEQNGLVLLDADLPPAPPSLTVAKKSDLPAGWDD